MRKHRCILCGNRFVRIDTLRRHMEDGCPKKLELGLLDPPWATPVRSSFADFPACHRSYNLHPSYPSDHPASTTALTQQPLGSINSVTKRSRKPKAPTKDQTAWDRHQAEIYALYMIQNHTLTDVIGIMAQQHHFVAS